MIKNNKASMDCLYNRTQKAFNDFFLEKKDLLQFEKIVKEIIKINKQGFNFTLLSKKDRLSNHCLNVAIINEKTEDIYY